MSKQNARKLFILGGKRTPFGKFGGSLANINPVELSVHASMAAINSLKLNKEDIDHVVMGNVFPTTTDTTYGARHVALKLGLPEHTPGYLVNRLCGSGIQALWEAALMIREDASSLCLVTGSENMSGYPHFTYGARFGTKYGALQSVDVLTDTLHDKHAGCAMGVTAENLAKDFNISREACDKFAFESHSKAAKAYASGLYKDEIAEVEHKKGKVSVDEHLREDISLEGLAALRPSFNKDGVVTAGNASGIVDGAASLIVSSEDYASKAGISPLVEIVDFSVVGVDPTRMGIGPVPAIKKILEKNNLKISDIDIVEINEAFASQTLACAKELSIPLDILNINGGAIALGHPLGASGTRITLHLARTMKLKGAKWGIASACIGGGQGIAVLLKNI
jgi:acetyl-CoA acyltransferase 2